MDILASIRGLSFGLPDLYQQVSNHGWEIKKVSFDKQKDRFLAVATNPHGDEMEAFGPSEKVAISNLLLHVIHRNGMRSSKLSMWQSTFTDQLPQIAEAYSKAPLYEPKAAIAFMELGRDAEARAKALMGHLEVTVVNNPESYHDPEKMCDDIRKRRKLEVSRAGIEHPIWSTQQVIAFRIAFDVLGYCASGGDWGWEGTNRAFAAYAAMIPAEAQGALFTQVIGQTAYATYYRAYGPQKIALLPEFIEPAQEKENPHKLYRGIHPSQSYAPIAQPSVKPLIAHAGLDPIYSSELSQKSAGALSDPNEGWQSGVAPLPINAYLDHGDPLQASEVMANAGLIQTEWAQLNKEDPADLARMKLAITNAFRAVLLSPRKDLRWNCHDDQTQALTDQGWLTIDELQHYWSNQEPLRAAAYRDGGIVYEIPQQLIVQNYEGDLIGFQGRLYDVLVTPNHRMLTTDGELIPANEVPIFKGVGRGGYGPWVPTAGVHQTERIEAFTIPGCIQREPRTGCTPIIDRARYADTTVPMDDWLRWLGWYISEGWLDQRRRAHISQSVNSSVLPKAQSACGALALGRGLYCNPDMWVWGSLAPYTKPLGIWLEAHVGKGARNKRLPDFVFKLNTEQALILLHTLLMGDGNANGSWTSEQASAFYTSSTQLAHDVHRLALHCGLRSIVKLIRSETNEWKVSINPGRPTRLPKPTRRSYKGRVWCFTMPSGTLITRRNGKVAITGNSVHYQDISHIPADEDDPDVYYDALERSRQNWNVTRHGEDARYQHLPHWKLWKAVERIMYDRNPQAGWDTAVEEARRFVHRMEQHYQDMVMREDADQPEDKQRNMYQIQTEVNKHLSQELKNYIKEHQLGFDFEAAASPEQTSMEIDDPRAEIPDKSKYGAWMNTHLQAIAQISEHVDELLKAALFDAHERDGSGHHFRASVLQLGIPGVGPKVASFAWLLLAPLTSQLATIDSHMMDVLNHSGERESIAPRDYFKYERELGAGRDAAGYGHVPLGAFQWSLWDYKRTGPGSHQDHSGLRVLDPISHEQIDWKSKMPGNVGQSWQQPDWWLATQPERDAIGAEWDQGTAPYYPANQIPYAGVLPASVADHLASSPGQSASRDFGTKLISVNPINAGNGKVLYARTDTGVSILVNALPKPIALAITSRMESGQPSNSMLTTYAGTSAVSTPITLNWYRVEPTLSEEKDSLVNVIDKHIASTDIPLTKPIPISLRMEPGNVELVVSGLRYVAGLDPKMTNLAPTPWLIHPETGEKIMGMPGQTILQHAQSLGIGIPQVWQLEAGKD